MADVRVAVLFPGALGDFCLLAPALAAMHTRGIVIDLSVRRSLAPIVSLLLPGIRLGPPMDGAAMASLFGGAMDPVLTQWLGGADRVHAWLARADDDVAARLSAHVATVAMHAVPREDDGERHAGTDYAVALGLTSAPLVLRVTSPTAEVALPWGQPETARLVVHPGAGSPAKVWSHDGFRRVADGWRAAGGDVAVLLGPAEEGDVVAWTATGYPLMADRSILDAAALIASAASYVGNDSGVSHLAGALDRRGVVLFGPTRAARWRPLGGRLDVVEFAERSVDAVACEVLGRIVTPVP